MHLWMLQFWIHHHGNVPFKSNAVLTTQARVQLVELGTLSWCLSWQSSALERTRTGEETLNWLSGRKGRVLVPHQTENQHVNLTLQVGQSWPRSEAFPLLSLFHPASFWSNIKVTNTHRKSNKFSLHSKSNKFPIPSKYLNTQKQLLKSGKEIHLQKSCTYILCPNSSIPSSFRSPTWLPCSFKGRQTLNPWPYKVCRIGG